ncbi:membrane-spanning 4-domains subfamily A member 4A [Megalops cyprinoides]|uniref:membrane-spanning 4-domains subfamily A member 4A n=1 Tax=Megalops cyprinoides TaxID=118141 RepID=UPI001864AF15|nr:membrane-spanning 4-domains subfamily A member 4A [Megalops cyprinoides]XP_036403253.1 membrane-spanning 4-domains subfamily A member 4A [Megalops cyprinoides]
MSVMAAPGITPAEDERKPNTTVVGGSKPLHRFIRGEPKTIGVVMLFLGGSLFIFGIPMKMDPVQTSSDYFCSFWLGTLFIICGTLYVLAEHTPTKKLVTASMALSIVSILGVVLAFFEFIKGMVHAQIPLLHLSYSHKYGNVTEEENIALRSHMMQLYGMEGVFMFHCLAGGVLLIVMTAFARTALQSTKTQAIVVMHNLPSE